MLRIPAAQVANGHLPHVCPRHGEPAIEMKRMKLISKPPSWTPVLILLAVIVYVIVVTILRKTVQAPAWPWCAQCKAARSRNLAIGLPVLGLGIVLFAVGIATIDGDIGPIMFLLGLVAFLVGLIVAARSGAQTVAGAFVSQDGQFVEVPKSDPRFMQALQYGAAPQRF
ncbi:hypothetical protein ABT369_16845 [Dactylosporangium sp. NPDC000244]|uniref:hypothetical protein n=1 Tax=Dactylosporangium sp. NPDC000244 TaxID=3154365 RepID=UPI00331FE299